MIIKAQLALEMRLDKLLTVEEVAEAMGVTREEYMAIEHGKDARGLQMAFQTLLQMPPQWVSADQCSYETYGFQYLPN
jgi:transcriptional regulator with XRE-family HTH domain